MKPKVFSANQFISTKWNTSQDKADFANYFVYFVQSGFVKSKFTKKFYQELSHCFGNIAHYSIFQFYNVQFFSLRSKINFVKNCLNYHCYGDPIFVYSDVERELQKWLKQSKILEILEEKLNNELEINERAELVRLKEKYEEKEKILS